MFSLLPILMMILFSLFSVGFFRFFSHRRFYWLCIVQQDNFNLNFWWKVVIHTIFVQKNCRRKVKPQGGWHLAVISRVPITPFIGVITPAQAIYRGPIIPCCCYVFAGWGWGFAATRGVWNQPFGDFSGWRKNGESENLVARMSFSARKQGRNWFFCVLLVGCSWNV